MDERDPLDDLPGLARFGEQLEAAARREDATSARINAPRLRRSFRGLGLIAVVLFGVTSSAAAGTAFVLRAAVIRAPAPADMPAEQTPLAETSRVSDGRATDPAGGPPWALRLASSRTGLTCTTVGQVRDGAFGIIGGDGRFRRLPGAIADACGSDHGTLVGARIVAAAKPQEVRSIVYGVGGPQLRRATLFSTDGRQVLKLGDDGTFVAALPGFPEDRAIRVKLSFAGGRVERHNLGVAPGVLPDPLGGSAWELQRRKRGSRQVCALLTGLRPLAQGHNERSSTPPACVDLGGARPWVAEARRLAPGDRGGLGFDRWNWRQHPTRTVLWGVARAGDVVRDVTLLGAGRPRRLDVTSKGTFAAVLSSQVDPRRLRLVVRLRDGRVERRRPGIGLADHRVRSRRSR